MSNSEGNTSPESNHIGQLAFEVRKVLVISTAHLTQRTCQEFKKWPYISDHECGAYFYVGDEPELYTDAPGDLQQVLAFAHTLGCVEVKFDQDADYVPNLPRYRWDDAERFDRIREGGLNTTPRCSQKAERNGSEVSGQRKKGANTLETLESAKEVLQRYAGSEKVADLYDDDEKFADALRVLAGSEFEYPDFSYLTVTQAIQKAERMGRQLMNQLKLAKSAEEVDCLLQHAAEKAGYFNVLDVPWDLWHYGKHAEVAFVHGMSKLSEALSFAWKLDDSRMPVESVPESVRKVRIHTMQTSKTYPALTVVIADLHLNADLVNDRQIRLADQLARSHGLELEVDPALQDRVNRALKSQRMVTDSTPSRDR